VVDDAILHVAALIHPDVKEERVFGFAAPYTWNLFLDTFRKLYPQKQFIPNLPDLGEDLSKVPKERAEQLLKDLGRDGWTSLADSLLANTEDLV
jgi:hypothetical protein